MKEIMPFLLAQWPFSLAFLITLVALVVLEIKDRQGAGKRVNCTELTRLINHEKAVMVDVRGAVDFAQGHIIGSINITPETFKDHHAQLRKMASRPIILVDNNGSTVGPMMKLLTQEGLTVSFLGGGLNAWRQEGFPLTMIED